MARGHNFIKSAMGAAEKYLPDVLGKYMKPMFNNMFPSDILMNQSKRDLSGSQNILPKQVANKPQRKWHGTIGIIGLDPTKVVTLNREIIEYGNSIGLTDDQEFPEVMSVGVKSDKAWHLEDQAKLCHDVGCDVVAVAGDTNDDESILNKRLETAIHPVPIMFLHKQDFKRLAKETFDSACSVEKPKRPDLLYSEDGSNFENEEKRINANMVLDSRNREKRTNERYKYGGGYPFLNNTIFGGIIGGAGPLASNDLCEKLARTSVPFIHYSVNSAPGKYRFEMGQGPSFIDHYRNAVDLFNNLGAEFLAVPCNTAHKRREEFCGKLLPKLVDIRESVLEVNENAEGFILLGTRITTGVGMPKGETGTYERIRSSYPKQGPFNVPSERQQGVIMEAIYDVKAGNLDEAKGKIMVVVKEMRKTYGEDLPVILACTELPLANFEPLELVSLKFVDPADALASKSADRVEAAKILAKIKKEENEKNSANDSPKTSIENPNASSVVAELTPAQTPGHH